MYTEYPKGLKALLILFVCMVVIKAVVGCIHGSCMLVGGWVRLTQTAVFHGPHLVPTWA